MPFGFTLYVPVGGRVYCIFINSIDDNPSDKLVQCVISSVGLLRLQHISPPMEIGDAFSWCLRTVYEREWAIQNLAQVSRKLLKGYQQE